jgi:hypothetical protein
MLSEPPFASMRVDAGVFRLTKLLLAETHHEHIPQEIVCSCYF